MVYTHAQDYLKMLFLSYMVPYSSVVILFLQSNSSILQIVRCRHGHEIDRDEFQEILSEANPSWKAFVEDLDSKGQKLRTNPDGDVGLSL
jgi:hypothetical protein